MWPGPQNTQKHEYRNHVPTPSGVHLAPVASKRRVQVGDVPEWIREHAFLCREGCSDRCGRGPKTHRNKNIGTTCPPLRVFTWLRWLVSEGYRWATYQNGSENTHFYAEKAAPIDVAGAPKHTETRISEPRAH